MKLKHATLIALIGSLLSLIGYVINVANTLMMPDVSLSTSYYTTTLLFLIQHISFILFFGILYKNQK